LKAFYQTPSEIKFMEDQSASRKFYRLVLSSNSEILFLRDFSCTLKAKSYYH